MLQGKKERSFLPISLEARSMSVNLVTLASWRSGAADGGSDRDG